VSLILGVGTYGIIGARGTPNTDNTQDISILKSTPETFGNLNIKVTYAQPLPSEI